MDKWDIFKTSDEPGSTPASPTIDVDKERLIALSTLANEFHQALAQASELQETVDRLSGEIAHLFPAVAGEQTEQVDDMHVRVSRSEKYKWDKPELERLFDQGEIPQFVSRSLSIHKRTYDRLPADEQEKVRHALTKELNPPKVEVIK